MSKLVLLLRTNRKTISPPMARPRLSARSRSASRTQHPRPVELQELLALGRIGQHRPRHAPRHERPRPAQQPQVERQRLDGGQATRGRGPTRAARCRPATTATTRRTRRTQGRQTGASIRAATGQVPAAGQCPSQQPARRPPDDHAAQGHRGRPQGAGQEQRAGRADLGRRRSAREAAPATAPATGDRGKPHGGDPHGRGQPGKQPPATAHRRRGRAGASPARPPPATRPRLGGNHARSGSGTAYCA